MTRKSCLALLLVTLVLVFLAREVRAVMLAGPGVPVQNMATYGSDPDPHNPSELDGEYKIDGGGKLTVTVKGYCMSFACVLPQVAGTEVRGTLTVKGTRVVDGNTVTWTGQHQGISTTCPGSSAEYLAYVNLPGGLRITSVKVTITAKCICCIGTNKVMPEDPAWPDFTWLPRDVDPS